MVHVNLPSPKSPRSIVAPPPPNPDALDPGSPSRDINAIVEDAAKRFDVMDKDLRCLLQDLKDYQASMKEMSDMRLKTAKHLESFATNSPFASLVSPTQKALVGTEGSVHSECSVHSGSGSAESVASGEAPTGKEDEAALKDESATQVTTKTENTTKSGETEPEATTETKVFTEEPSSASKPTAADLESFAGVHQTMHAMASKYHAQYGEYLFSYVENWERVVSQRIKGLLIHYRELQDNVTHYNKKVGGLVKRVDKAKSVRSGLVERLDRNEIKEMGAVEARDTVGEHLYLYIEEVMDRAWRDVFPLLLRACRFEADFSAAEARVLSNLATVAEGIQVIGEDDGCDVMGRLDDLEKKHPEEVSTEENPFVKLTPRKKIGKQPEIPNKADSDVVEAAEAKEPTSSTESHSESMEKVEV